MIQLILFTSLMLYVVALLIGFHMHRGSKDKLNKEYKHFKPWLMFFILVIFLYSLIILYYGATLYSPLYYFLGVDLLFIFYFLYFARHQSRCWKQHRILFYNFILIILNYYISLLVGNMYLNFFVFAICIYTIVEFQFAKFSLKKPFLWD